MSRVKPLRHMPSRMQDRPGRWKLIWRRQRRMLRPALAGAVLLGGLLLASVAVQSFGEGASIRERRGDVTARMGLRVAAIRIEGRPQTPAPRVRAADLGEVWRSRGDRTRRRRCWW